MIELVPGTVRKAHRSVHHFGLAGRFGLVGLVGLAVLVAGCGGGGGKGSLQKTRPTAEPNDTSLAVTIRPDPASVGSFGPQTLQVHAGERVVWNNWSTNTHTVTFDDPTIGSSPDLGGGGTWTARFAVAGSFPYHCRIHPAMTGTIVAA